MEVCHSPEVRKQSRNPKTAEWCQPNAVGGRDHYPTDPRVTNVACDCQTRLAGAVWRRVLSVSPGVGMFPQGRRAHGQAGWACSCMGSARGCTVSRLFFEGFRVVYLMLSIA